MARLANRCAEVGLREYLLEAAVEFRAMYGHYGPEYWAVLSRPVDQLLAGEPYRLHRFELPDDHPERRVGWPSDSLVLTEHDELSSVAMR